MHLFKCLRRNGKAERKQLYIHSVREFFFLNKLWNCLAFYALIVYKRSLQKTGNVKPTKLKICLEMRAIINIEFTLIKPKYNVMAHYNDMH